ncbi:MAG: YggS family pyridoxal phosphate-dependent enzyme [Fimbriimonas sp.]
MTANLALNLRAVQDRIARAAEASGRDPASVTLVAVSKTYPVDAIRAAYDLGLRHFGESRLQEAQPKIEILPGDIQWHFIGHLQSNKAKRVGQFFDVVHTLHNEGQLRELAKAGRQVDGLIEVNIAEESQKSGLPLADVAAFRKIVLDYAQVRFRGLMTIGPAVENAEQMRPYFRSLREANQAAGGSWLSMGMSHDFEVAIQEGSTHVRVGTALFGAR